MAHVPTPDLPEKTFLFWLGWKWYFVSDRYETKAAEIASVYLLGKYLAAFYRYLAGLFDDAAHLLFDGDGILRSIIAWLDGMVNGNTFVDLLDWVSGQYKAIRNDPVGWVKDRFKSISGSMRALIDDPGGFVRYYIGNLTWWWAHFLDDPWTWLRDRLDEKFWWFPVWRADPIGKVADWAKAKMPFLRDIEFNPPSWVVTNLEYWYGWIRSFLNDPRSFIFGQMKAVSIAIGDFLTNPHIFIRDRIKAELGLGEVEFNDLWGTIFDRILVNVLYYINRARGRFEQTVCDILMMFI